MGIFNNTLNAMKQISPYLMAIFGIVMGAYVSTILLGYLDLSVIPNLGLNNTTASSEASTIIQDGADSIYNIAAIALISTGLMALATIVSAFGFNQLDRFKISTNALVKLMQSLGITTGIYAGIIFVMALVRIFIGYLEHKITGSLGFVDGSWVMTKLASLTTILADVLTGVAPLLEIGVGLITLAMVMKAFGYEINFGMKKGKKKGNY